MWPWTFLAETPEGRPCTAPFWHVLEIQDDDGLVVGVVGCDADTVASPVSGLDGLEGVGSHHEFRIGG